MIEFNRVTTRTGDNGTSAIYGGKRLKKNHPVFHVLGAVDELTAWLGVVRNTLYREDARNEAGQIEAVQQDLLRLGSEVAVPAESKTSIQQNLLGDGDVERLESWERALMKMVELPPDFIIPGETLVASYIDVARTVARKLERLYVSIKRANSLVYLNRLSDYLFVLARRFESKKEYSK